MLEISYKATKIGTVVVIGVKYKRVITKDYYGTSHTLYSDMDLTV